MGGSFSRNKMSSSSPESTEIPLRHARSEPTRSPKRSPPYNVSRTRSMPSKTPKRAGQEVICNICCSNGDDVVIPIGKVTSKCMHHRTICVNCLERHIRQAVLKQDYNNIACLCTSTECPNKLGPKHVLKYADKDTFHLYDEGLLHQLLEKDPEFCWCSRAGCGSGQLHASGDRYPVMRCHVCRARTCFTHRCPWHDGRTCKEYNRDANRSDEVALLQLLENNKYQRCPVCKHGVEKKSGCDHMTCRCKHEFCWRCLAPYGGEKGIWKMGNAAHKKTCTYYRRWKK